MICMIMMIAMINKVPMANHLSFPITGITKII